MAEDREFIWKPVYDGEPVQTGENSQVRASIVGKNDGSVFGVIVLSKWASYCTKKDKEAGLTKETVPYRPSYNKSKIEKISFPAVAIPEIIADLQRMYDYAVENDLLDEELAEVLAEKKPKKKPVKKPVKRATKSVK